MNEQVKKRKRVQKRVRHEATKKRTRKHKMVAANAVVRKEAVKQDIGPPGQGSHSDFMKQKRR